MRSVNDEEGSSATSTVQDVTDVTDVKDGRKKEDLSASVAEGRRFRLPMPDALFGRCPMPDALFGRCPVWPMPNSQFPILNSQFKLQFS
ncbi:MULTISPECIES: hypothetical protein [unclassified Microcoleus]|uniref:hypothetical protein n=1 Tax=unclassified Microcoleus TaxID=2642155 RepID=UPI0025EA0EF5|nr:MULTISPECIES: hypothetical protein [unclassified Microcoleus]